MSAVRRTAVVLATVGSALVAIAAAVPASGAPPRAAPAPVAVREAAPGQAAPLTAATVGVTQPAVDLSTLNMVPTPMAGVINPDPARTSTSSIGSDVWAIRQAGSRIFVGGMFLDVQANATATAVRQPFLAAFDLKTGAYDPSCTPALDNAVYALAVSPTGSLLVGGEFTTVNGLRRPGLVALDPATCAVDGTFPDAVLRPYSTSRAVVRTLEVAGGALYVGGNFSKMVGPPRKGGILLGTPPAVPPATATRCAAEGADCTLASGTTSTVWFGAGSSWVRRSYLSDAVSCSTSTFGDPAVGTAKSCYAVSDGTTTTGVYKVARVDATTGALDITWKPAVTGSGVWGLAVDTTRNRVHLGGWFSGVGAVAGTGNYAVVDGTTGAVVTGLIARPRNSLARTEIYDVSMGASDRVLVGGSEHILQLLDAGTGKQLAYAHTGYNGCGTDRFTWCGYIGAGGDFQVVEKIGAYVFAGCHCTRDHVNSSAAHYSSVTGTFSQYKNLMAYDPSTEALVTSFYPDVDGAVEGSWAVGSDTNGCLYIGGDFTKGGARAGRSMWVSGIAKLCPKVVKTTTDTTAPTAAKNLEAVDTGNGTVQVTWTAATDNVGVDHYTVSRSGAAPVTVTAVPATLTGIPAGTTTLVVDAVDAASNTSPDAGVQVTTGAAGADTASPTAPANLAAAAAATGTTLTWTASADAVGVQSYLVYRDGGYVGWSASTTWTDTSAPHGTAVRYEVRATDAAGNRSVKSAPVDFTLP